MIKIWLFSTTITITFLYKLMSKILIIDDENDICFLPIKIFSMMKILIVKTAINSRTSIRKV